MADTAITELSVDQLVEKRAEGKRELFNLRFQLATGALENSSRIKQVKRDVARVSTELRARELAAAKAASVGEA